MDYYWLCVWEGCIILLLAHELNRVSIWRTPHRLPLPPFTGKQNKTQKGLTDIWRRNYKLGQEG